MQTLHSVMSIHKVQTKKYYNIGARGQYYKKNFARDLRIFILSVCKTRLEKLARNKHFSLLRKFGDYGQKSFITLRPGQNGICLYLMSNRKLLTKKYYNIGSSCDSGKVCLFWYERSIEHRAAFLQLENCQSW